jgi:hypothetical protein
MRGLIILILIAIGLGITAWRHADDWISILCIVGIVWLGMLIMRRAFENAGHEVNDRIRSPWHFWRLW